MPALTCSLTWACGPSITETASPGITRNARNASVAAPHSTKTADAAIPATLLTRRATWTRMSVGEARVVEQRTAVQVVVQTRDVLRGCGDLRGDVQRHDGHVLGVPLLDLRVD